MSSSSRRKKSYDNNLRKFQNRNIFAGIVLAAAACFAIWLVIISMPGNIPEIHLSTNFVNYEGTQKEIPFVKKSCNVVIDAFTANLGNVNAEKPCELDSRENGCKFRTRKTTMS